MCVGDALSMCDVTAGSLLLALAECYQSLHERTVLQEAAELRAAAMQHATHACHSLLHHVYFEVRYLPPLPPTTDLTEPRMPPQRLSGASTSAAAAAQPPAARGVTAAQLEEGLWQAVVVLAEGPQEATSAAVADASTECVPRPGLRERGGASVPHARCAQTAAPGPRDPHWPSPARQPQDDAGAARPPARCPCQRCTGAQLGCAAV